MTSDVVEQKAGERASAAEGGGESVGVSDADPERRVGLESDDLRNLLDELDAQAQVMIGTEREAVIGKAQPGADRGVPAMRTGDLGVVDVLQRCLEPQDSERRPKQTVIGERHAVLAADPHGGEHGSPPAIELIRKELAHGSHPASGLPPGVTGAVSSATNGCVAH
jgi:hypothetical protein